MMPVKPILIPMPFAQNGTRNEIPAESPGASQPNASWSGGFPPITMFNRQAGGLPPLGQDFNGILNALSQQAFWRQSGGMAQWSADLDYPVPALVVGSDGKYYTSVQPSGPSGSGAKDPTDAANSAYWAQAVLDGSAAVFTPPTASKPGEKGLVPAPGAMSNASEYYLGADAKFHLIPGIAVPDYANAISVYNQATWGSNSGDEIKYNVQENGIIYGYFDMFTGQATNSSRQIFLTLEIDDFEMTNFVGLAAYWSNTASYRTVNPYLFPVKKGSTIKANVVNTGSSSGWYAKLTMYFAVFGS